MNSPVENILVLDSSQILQNLKARGNPSWTQYYAFYSSWFGGIVKDPGPWLMVPMDDHLVHRGDGVFEALKSRNRKVYLLEAHLQRLAASSAAIGIPLPHSIEDLSRIILKTLKVADQGDSLIRVFLSRGPGGFTTNPYDSLGAQFYVAITKLQPPSTEKYENGVKVGRSQIPVKEEWMARVKSCNYLPNVLMKKESVDRKLDFTVSFDEQGFLAESSTENIVIVDSAGVLTHPPLERILRGTTMIRVFELANQAGIKTAVRKISEKDVLSAQEVFMTGTTLDVLPVVEYEGKPIAHGKVGPIARQLKKLLEDDMKSGKDF